MPDPEAKPKTAHKHICFCRHGYNAVLPPVALMSFLRRHPLGKLLKDSKDDSKVASELARN